MAAAMEGMFKDVRPIVVASSLLQAVMCQVRGNNECGLSFTDEVRSVGALIDTLDSFETNKVKAIIINE